MKQIREVVQQIISISDAELDNFLSQAKLKQFKKQEVVVSSNAVPQEIFFI